MNCTYNYSDSSLAYSSTESERSNHKKKPKKVLYVPPKETDHPFIIRRASTADYSAREAKRVDWFVEEKKEERRVHRKEKERLDEISSRKLREEELVEKRDREERVVRRLDDQRAVRRVQRGTAGTGTNEHFKKEDGGKREESDDGLGRRFIGFVRRKS